MKELLVKAGCYTILAALAVVGAWVFYDIETIKGLAKVFGGAIVVIFLIDCWL